MLLLAFFCSCCSLVLLHYLNKSTAVEDLQEASPLLPIALSVGLALLILAVVTCCRGGSGEEGKATPTPGAAGQSAKELPAGSEKHPAKVERRHWRQGARSRRDGGVAAVAAAEFAPTTAPAVWGAATAEETWGPRVSEVGQAEGFTANQLLGTWSYEDGAGLFRLVERASHRLYYEEDIGDGRHAYCHLQRRPDGSLGGTLLVGDAHGEALELGAMRLDYDRYRDAIVYGVRCAGELDWRTDQVGLRAQMGMRVGDPDRLEWGSGQQAPQFMESGLRLPGQDFAARLLCSSGGGLCSACQQESTEMVELIEVSVPQKASLNSEQEEDYRLDLWTDDSLAGGCGTRAAF